MNSSIVDLTQIIISGIANGMIYALVAFGYNITFSTSKMFNFSNSNFMMLGAVLSFILIITFKIPFLFMIFIVMAISIILGFILYKTSILPAIKFKSSHSWILATLAFAMIIQNGVEVFWGTDDVKIISTLGDSLIKIFGVNIYPQEILVIIVAILIVVLIELFKSKSLFGKAIIAVSEDKNTASLMGINQTFVILFSFLLSSIVAGIAGVLVAPLVLVSSTLGAGIGIKSYAVSIVGGLESGKGVLIGGVIIGLSEALTSRYISSGYKEFPGFIFLILILCIAPSGLFGKKAIKKL